MQKLLLVLMLCSLTVLSFGPAFAIPCGQPTLLGHGFGAYFVCDDSRIVGAYAYQLSSPLLVSTGFQKIYCTAPDGVNCFGNSGPGQVTIESDWSNPAIAACPVDASGGHRIIIAVQCSDGKGLLVSLSGADSSINYLVEAAHPSDPSGSVFQPLVAGAQNGRPIINGSASVTGGSATMSLHFNKPIIYTDCDNGSLGMVLGSTCVDGVFTPNRDPLTDTTAVLLGHVFTSGQPCGAFPDAETSKWVDTGVVIPAGGGDVSVTAALPVQPATCASTVPPASRTGCLCLYVGGSTTVAGSPPGISGFVQAGGPEAASPVALAVMAEQAAGNVRVRWHTDSELGLAGFNILTDGGKQGLRKVNDGLIAATGKGAGASYDQFVPRGKFQESRTVIIESVMKDGTTLRSTPVKF